MTRSNSRSRISLPSNEVKEKEECSTCSDGSTESKSQTQNNKKKRKRKKKKKRRRDKRRNSNVSERDENTNSLAAEAAATATNMKLIDDIIKDATETIQNNNEKLLDGSHPDLPKIVRLHRERRTKEDACLICLDNGSNDNKPIEMFSSCCGQAYHIQCYYNQIQSTNTVSSESCGVCRTKLPELVLKTKTRKSEKRENQGNGGGSSTTTISTTSAI